MEDWIAPIFHALWRNALAAVPLVVLVAGVCRWVPCRPSTRHALWLITLLWYAAASALPTSNLISGMIAASREIDPAPTPARDESPEPDRALRVSSPPLVSGPRRAEPDRRTRVALVPNETDVAFSGVPARGRSILKKSHARPSPRFKFERRRPPREERVYSSVPAPPPRIAPEQLTPPIDPRELDALISRATEQVLGTGTEREDRVAVVPASVDDDSPAVANGPALAAPIRRVAPVERVDRVDSRDAGTLREWMSGWMAVRDAVGAISPIPVSVWSSGLAVCVGYAAICIAVFCGRLRRAYPAPPSVAKLVGECAEAMGLKRVPETMMVRRHVSPMVLCGRRVRIVLPEQLWSELDEDGRRAVVCHELAHVRRRDHWVNWLQLTVCAVYWWNPLVWWVRRRINEEAEFCCDAWVTWLFPRQRRVYAETLLKTKQYLSRPPHRVVPIGIGMTTGRAGRFARRLKMVMTESQKPRLSVSGMTLVLCLAAAGWVATPAISCPKSDAPKACKTKRTHDGESRRSSVPAPDAPEPDGGNTYRWHLEHGRNAAAASEGLARLSRLYTAVGDPRLVGDHTPVDGKTKKKLSKRLKELERQIDRMADQIELIREGLSDIHPAPPARRVHGKTKRHAPKPPKAPKAPKAQKRRNVFPGGRVGSSAAPMRWRMYNLPAGQSEALAKLMVRSDVPIYVRPQDEGIEVQATPEQHAVFEAFVGMLAHEGRTEHRTYHLSQGKLDALSALMVRDDVPILVTPQGDSIQVQGNALEQSVFGAFLRLIEPSRGRDRAATPNSTSAFFRAEAYRAEAMESAARASVREAPAADVSVSEPEASALEEVARAFLAAGVKTLEMQASAIEDVASDE